MRDIDPSQLGYIIDYRRPYRSGDSVSFTLMKYIRRPPPSAFWKFPRPTSEFVLEADDRAPSAVRFRPLSKFF